MKKSKLSYYYIIVMLFCQICLCLAQPVQAATEAQLNAVSDHCASIKQSLEVVRKQDARTRVFLGSHYEIILSRYIKPLNHRLIDNSTIDTNLATNQSDYAALKLTFSNDYIIYQKALEELININCKTESEDFYSQLEIVRAKRATMSEDVAKMSKLIDEHQEFVTYLRENL